MTGLGTRFAAQVAATPDAVAVVDGATRITYRDLDARADRLARHLAGLGVGPEVVVGVCLPRGIGAVTALLAILKAGGGYLPLDPAHPAARLTGMLEIARARLVVGPSPDPRLPSVPPEPAESDVDGVLPPAPAEALACVLFTSGSTGQPKGIGLGPAPIENVADWAAAGPVVCGHLCSLGFDMSLQEIFGTLLGGGRLVVVDEDRRKDPYLLMDLIAAEGIERLYLSPGFLVQLAGAYLARERTPGLGSLRHIVAAGERLRVTAGMRRFFTEVGARLENQYGPSETHQATANPLPGDPAGWPAEPSLGGPIPTTTVHLLDEDLRPVRDGEPGEVYIGGRGVARGYLGQPALTAAKFLPDPFTGEPGARMYRTGDRARRDGSGALRFLGRLDNQVKVRGFRVEPGDAEAVLAAYPGVGQAVVVPHDGPGGSVRLDGYLVCGEPAPDLAAVRAFAARRLPDYLVPATLQVLASLPLNRNGKVDRQALPLPPSGRGSPVPYVPPSTDQEALLCGLIADVLGTGRVGVTDDFLDLGGNSLLATRLVTALVGAFGVEIPVRAVFDHRTARALAAVVEDALVARVRALSAAELSAALASGEGPCA
ncbi:non-ribosomal peptide synthetase [Amycolatopsis sp. NBC_01488]|uniref:non-ribosomal peptide synthetase n=1 Tax=Amycolatopsis sp. NBC_01488 TaxID=2903563 RepID=UPI002E294BAB|nr:non-ribosomal peptide synthetase [Amycolatopsis sp. NBC_01488]